MKKSIFQENIVSVPLYPCKLGILICDDVYKINSILGTNYDEVKVGLTTAHDLTFYITLNPNHPDYFVSEGIIAHESLHAVNMLFERLGISYNNHNDEHAAYLLSWFVDTVTKYYKKSLTKKKKK